MKLFLTLSIFVNVLFCGLVFYQKNGSKNNSNKYQVCEAGVPKGELIPSFSGETSKGHPLSLDALRGKKTLVIFWALWCKPCVEEIPRMVKLYEEYKDKGINFVSINVDGLGKKNEVLEFIEKQKILFDVILSSPQETSKKLFMKSYPTNWLVGADGKLIRSFNGMSDEQFKDIESSFKSEAVVQF